jgi:hypothetical protein
MTLEEFKKHIESFPPGYLFEFSLSQPFSWRGAYDEVCFRVLKQRSTKEVVLGRINESFDGTFTGYKGGEFKYEPWTKVNFEAEHRDCSAGQYTAEMIAEIEGERAYKTQERRLVELAFK